MTWREQAACRDHPHEWWLGPATKPRDDARTVCRACPVQDACLREQVEIEAKLGYPMHGLYGGLSEDERRKLIRRLAAAGGPGAVVLPDNGHGMVARHGTQYSYQAHGCRCDACRAAHAATVAGWRKRKAS